VILRRISEFSLDRFEVILVHFERALYFFVTCVVHLLNDGSDKLKKNSQYLGGVFGIWDPGAVNGRQSDVDEAKIVIFQKELNSD
jgi:hypothetical protein